MPIKQLVLGSQAQRAYLPHTWTGPDTWEYSYTEQLACRFRHDSMMKAMAWFVGAPLIASNGQRLGGV